MSMPLFHVTLGVTPSSVLAGGAGGVLCIIFSSLRWLLFASKARISSSTFLESCSRSRSFSSKGSTCSSARIHEVLLHGAWYDRNAFVRRVLSLHYLSLLQFQRLDHDTKSVHSLYNSSFVSAFFLTSLGKPPACCCAGVSVDGPLCAGADVDRIRATRRCRAFLTVSQSLNGMMTSPENSLTEGPESVGFFSKPLGTKLLS